MSGGVDSSVTAALLKQQGYSVTGVYMKNWTASVAGYSCSWKTDFQDAKRVAVQLDIPFKVYDFELQYRQQVVAVMQTALDDGADMIATGHYARLVGGKLFRAQDSNKDQTYFLYRVSAKALSQTIMPLGTYTKPQIRSIAKHLNLATADKKDSQGICFIGEIPIAEFLVAELGPQTTGPIIDQNGKLVGTHDGAILYTIGQRHGLHVGGGLPYYVTGKDIMRNKIFVTTDLQDEQLWRHSIDLGDIHWINGPPPFGAGSYYRDAEIVTQPVEADFGRRCQGCYGWSISGDL